MQPIQARQGCEGITGLQQQVECSWPTIFTPYNASEDAMIQVTVMMRHIEKNTHKHIVYHGTLYTKVRYIVVCAAVKQQHESTIESSVSSL